MHLAKQDHQALVLALGHQPKAADLQDDELIDVRPVSRTTRSSWHHQVS
ncbi:hypothetical protein [Streptomyces sp. cg40]